MFERKVLLGFMRIHILYHALEDEGIYGTPIVFPMVARELSRIRVQMNALLTKEDLNMALSSIEKVGKKLGII